MVLYGKGAGKMVQAHMGICLDVGAFCGRIGSLEFACIPKPVPASWVILALQEFGHHTREIWLPAGASFMFFELGSKSHYFTHVFYFRGYHCYVGRADDPVPQRSEPKSLMREVHVVLVFRIFVQRSKKRSVPISTG